MTSPVTLLSRMWNTCAASARRISCLKFNPARLSPSANVHQHDNAFVVELAVLVRDRVEILPGSKELAHAICHPRQLRPGPRIGPIGEHELDLWVRPISPTELPAFPHRVDRAHEVEVL
jgi:hypothetical protein